jgi:DNA-binding MarR family transcriptional regulator
MPQEFFSRLFNEHGERNILLESTTKGGRQLRKRFAALLPPQVAVKATYLKFATALRAVDVLVIAPDLGVILAGIAVANRADDIHRV